MVSDNNDAVPKESLVPLNPFENTSIILDTIGWFPTGRWGWCRLQVL